MSRVAFTIFGVPIMWYGVIISFGIAVAYLLMNYRAKRQGFSEDIVTDWAFWTVPIGIVGARLYYVIFEWNRYSGDFFKIINIRNGGLAIHGGIIAGIITTIIFCKIKKLSFWEWADLAIPSVALAQGIGRWGNFTNQEAHGRATDLPWAIIVDGEKVHPTFLYESLGDVLICIFLLFLSKKKKNSGDLFLMYVILYSLLRFFVESLRTDSLYIGPLRTAQLVSVIGIIAALVILFKKHKEKEKD